MSNNITVKKWSVSIRKRERYADPRAIQIDLDADYVNTSQHPDSSIHSDRVMPLLNPKKFCSILRSKTKTFKYIDNSHFWVSGYYALYFYMKDKRDSRRIKKLVVEAVKESGGFMSFDDWYKQHNKKNTSIIQFAGSGSGIQCIDSNITERIAFL